MNHTHDETTYALLWSSTQHAFHVELLLLSFYSYKILDRQLFRQ